MEQKQFFKGVIMINRFFLLLVGTLTFALVGCGSITKQNNINKAMDSYVFEAPAPKVYEAAVEVYKGMYTPLTEKTGELSGASQWVTENKTLGTMTYRERSRFSVEVTAKGDGKSIVRCFREYQKESDEKWGEVIKGRMQAHEFYVLKKVNSQAAADIEKNAAAE